MNETSVCNTDNNTRNPKYSEKNLMLIHPPQITPGMTWDRTHDSTVKLVGDWPNTQHERNEHKIVVQNLIKNVEDNLKICL